MHDKYNIKYNFNNSNINTIYNELQNAVDYDYSNDIMQFIKNYVNHENCIFLDIDYKQKYLKYKQKYLKRKFLNNFKIDY